MVTAGTYQKEHFFRENRRLDVIQRGLLNLSTEFGWHMEAWAIFSNHYHFVAHSPPGENSSASLGKMLSKLHTLTGAWINRLDKTPKRKIWHNYMETRLTYERSYFARLNYVHQNPVRHGLVHQVNQYPWCSARWFESTATPSQVKTIYNFDASKVKVADDYLPLVD